MFYYIIINVNNFIIVKYDNMNISKLIKIYS